MAETRILVYDHSRGTTRAARPSSMPTPAPQAAARQSSSATETPAASSNAFIFHRRGKHSTVTLSTSTVHGHLAHGSSALVRAIDPCNALTIPAPVVESPKACYRISSLADPSTEDDASRSIRATPTSSGLAEPAFAPPAARCEELPEASYSPTTTPLSARAWPRAAAEAESLLGHTTPGRKLRAGANGQSSHPRNVIDDSEVIPACPAMAVSPGSHPDTPAAAPRSAPRARSASPPLDEQGSCLASCSQLGEGDESFITPRGDRECATECAPATVAELKQRALLGLPTPSPPQRAHSVIPSEVYAGASPPTSHRDAVGASPEPCTLARTGCLQAGLIRQDTPPATYVPELFEHARQAALADADGSQGTEVEGALPVRLRGCGRGNSFSDAHLAGWLGGADESDDDNAAVVPGRVSALHAALRAHSVLSTERALDRESTDDAAQRDSGSSVLSTQSQTMRSAQPHREGSYPVELPVRAPARPRPLDTDASPEARTPTRTPLRRGLHSGPLQGMPSPVPQLPGGGTPEICEIDPWDEDSRVCSPTSNATYESEAGPLLAGSSAAQSLQWRDNAWTGSTWRGRSAALDDGGGSGASGRQACVLCALPTDTPAGLLFGLLLPLILGWHVVLEDSGVSGNRDDAVVHGTWEAMQEHAAALHGIFMSVAHCDAVTRGAMGALASSGAAASAVTPFSLAKLRVCAIFGPCLTPPVAQSLFASMQPFGLRCVSCMR